MTTDTTDLTATVDAYLAAWSEPDRARREQLIVAAWADDGQLVDPPLTGDGHSGINAASEALQEHYLGHRFERVSGVDAHHDSLRFAWELVGPDGAVALAGLDVGQLDDQGRLRRITGFFGELPAR